MAVISAVALERIIINKNDISEIFFLLKNLQVFQTVFRFKMKSSWVRITYLCLYITDACLYVSQFLFSAW